MLTLMISLLRPFCILAAYLHKLGIASAGQAGFVANMADIAPGSAGQMFGLCGTFASLAGIIATSSVGLIVERTGNGMAPWTYLEHAGVIMPVLRWRVSPLNAGA